MSKQSKQRNKRRVRNTVVYSEYEVNKAGITVKSGKRKGPSRTNPSHGKRNTWYNKLKAEGRVKS